jgi:porphobilinogen synthase
MTQTYPLVKEMRIRRNSILRKMSEMAIPGPEKFIWPVFIKPGDNIREPISALSVQYYYSVDKVSEDIKKVIKQGVKSILVFGVVPNEFRSKEAEYSYKENGIEQEAIKKIRKDFPEIVIFGEIGLTGYTDNGHAQLINDDGKFDNKKSLEAIKKIALSLVRAGADGITPSGMIDGQVRELRNHLDKNGFEDKIILSYSTKLNSNCYRTFPFDTASVKRSGLDRGAYLSSYLDSRDSIRESIIDEEEGADMLMVKPALFYLDLIKGIKSKTNIPLVAYNVSGEYSMVNSMIEKGFGELNGIVRESLCAIHRAGADVIISYWANQYNKIFLE